MRIITASFPAPLVKALGKDMSNFYKKYLYPFGISNSTEFTKATSQQVKRALSEKDPYTVAITRYYSFSFGVHPEAPITTRTSKCFFPILHSNI